MSDLNGAFRVLSDERVGEGGFLRLRRLRLRVVRADGTLTGEGLYDLVERPMGLDAVVLALWHRRHDGGVDVLLRESIRVPLAFGRPGHTGAIVELVAGILETGEDDFAALQKRAVAEAYEEAGLTISAVELLGPPLFPTPGMCAEKFHFAAAEVADPAAAVLPPGDGSPFEEGARLTWMDLDAALTAGLDDMKTELGLRRLKEFLNGR
jgi:8-oxo-dGTP pyrophosphatase MutT (NUDIX family)